MFIVAIRGVMPVRPVTNALKLFVVLILLLLLIFLPYAPVYALTGDGGTLSACYPGGFSQVLAGIKPFMTECVQFTTLGNCYCAGVPCGAMVSFWLPQYAIEVTGHANTTVFPFGLQDIVSPGFLLGATREGGMVQGETAGRVNTKYREAHLYELSRAEILQVLAGHPHQACMALMNLAAAGRTAFTSEAREDWRKGKDTTTSLTPADMLTKVGSWGYLFPRTGWVQHPSNVTGSLLLAFKAQHLAAELSTLSKPTVYVDKYEIGGPVSGACYPIGTTTTVQELNANKTGCADRFVVLYWKYITLCCPYGT
ncbi:MAG: hypothetical protein U0411_09665 [Thermodesulfovibrionales bacterium]